MGAGKGTDYAIEIGPIGPIGEGQALILRVSRNCPWNKCLFCPVYKGKKFSARSAQEIRGDIDAIGRIQELLEKTSWELGFSEKIREEAVREVMRKNPEIYEGYSGSANLQQLNALHSLNNVANWLLNGAKRVFLQDANALAMKPKELIQVLKYLKESYPTVDTITCYARSKTCARRSLEELKEFKEAGLSWCFVGIESGLNEVLDYMKKGVSMAKHIEGGKKVMNAGINMAAFVMPGLSGNTKDMAQKHILDTLTVLNEIQPTEVRVRSLAVLEGTPLYTRWESGEFGAPGEDQMIEELRMLIEGIKFDCTFETLQMTNSLFTIKGRLSQKRQIMCETIDWYQALPPLERARFLLGRYADHGYLDCVKAWGMYDSRLHYLIEDANKSISKGLGDALEKTELALFAIKSKGVP